ncbi:MAG: hypothetical protein AAFS10_04210 [Myxococcota bacterium]
MFQPHTITFAAVLMIAVVHLSGCCSEFTRVQECNALIDTVNSNQFNLDGSAGEDPKQFIAQLQSMAKKAEEGAKSIENLGLTDETLVQHAKSYRTMLRDLSKAAADMATALEAMNSTANEAESVKTTVEMEALKARLEVHEKEVEGQQKRFDALVDKEDTVVDAINGYCTP